MDIGQSVIDVQLVLLQDDLFNETLNALALAFLVGDLLVVDGGETDLQLISLVLAPVAADLSLGAQVQLSGEALGQSARITGSAGSAASLVAVDVDAEVLALLQGQLVARGEAPLLVQLLESSDDSGTKDSLEKEKKRVKRHFYYLQLISTIKYLSGIITEHVSQIVQLNLEDLLGRLGLGAGGVDERSVGVLGVGVGPPEAFGAAGVELGGVLGESESVVAGDAANLEATAWTPVLTGLDATHRGVEWRTEGVWQKRGRINCLCCARRNTNLYTCYKSTRNNKLRYYIVQAKVKR